MATVTISRYECVRDLLPPVCAVCGGTATRKMSITYSWHPRWAEVLLFGAVLLTKRMPVQLPLCERDERNWRWRYFVALIGLLVTVAVGAATGAYLYIQPFGGASNMPGMLCCGSTLLFFLWLLVITVLQAGEIRPLQITDRSVSLVQVHPNFAMAVQEERDRNRSDDPDAHRRFEDVRDDYDDEQLPPPPRPSD